MTRRPKKLVNIRTTGVLYIRDLNVDIKNQFKAWCSRRGMSMTRQLESMMADLVTGEDKPDGLPKRTARA